MDLIIDFDRIFLEKRKYTMSILFFKNCAYTACNILCLIMVLLKLFVLFVHRKEFIDLLVYTHEHFWHTNYTYNELLLVEKCKRICMLCITLINVCAQGTIVSYVLTPIVGEFLLKLFQITTSLNEIRIFITIAIKYSWNRKN